LIREVGIKSNGEDCEGMELVACDEFNYFTRYYRSYGVKHRNRNIRNKSS